MPLKLKFVKGREYEAYITVIEKQNREIAKADEETAEEEQEAPVPLVIHVNNILPSISSNVEVYINNQERYNLMD